MPLPLPRPRLSIRWMMALVAVAALVSSAYAWLPAVRRQRDLARGFRSSAARWRSHARQAERDLAILRDSSVDGVHYDVVCVFDVPVAHQSDAARARAVETCLMMARHYDALARNHELARAIWSAAPPDAPTPRVWCEYMGSQSY